MDEVRDSLSGQAAVLCELLTSAMEPHLRRQGMSLATFELLSAIHSLRSRATQAEVARRLGITPPSLSESVKAASRFGWVEQEANPADARAKILRITPKGAKSLNTVVKAVRELEESMLSNLDAAETAMAISVLRKANKNLALGLQKTGL